MSDERLGYLFHRYLYKTYSEEEKQEFLQMLDDPSHAAALERLNAAVDTLPETGVTMDAQSTEAVRQALLTVTAQRPAAALPHARVHTLRRRVLRYAAAAVLLLAVAGAGWWWLRRPAVSPATLSKAERYKNEVAPGHNGAMLTLSNGRQIALDSAGDGLLTKDGEVQLLKKEGTIAYNGSAASDIYNRVETANGQQWQLALNDGTRVWLNAASSIRYPVAFSGHDREVEITGEAYLEVAANAAKPFRVKVGDQTVEVLGTHFNINAYTDEGVIKTTLLEGRVKMQSAVIAPGQQIQVRANGRLTVVDNADIEQAVAWKNGLFQFENADLASVMRQISRWYNVEIHYQGAVPQRSFGGAMQRTLPLTKVLAILEDNNVKFTIDGNRITVLP